MPATVLTAPPSVILGGDDTFITVTTDRTAPGRASCTFTFSGAGPSAGDVRWLGFGETIQLTATDTDTASATDFPTKPSGESLADYLVRVQEFFNQNHLIATTFEVLVELPATVRLRQRVQGPMTFQSSRGFFSNTVFAYTNFLGVNQVSAHLQVVTTPGVQQVLLNANSPYTPAQTTDFNIKAAFRGLLPHLPSWTTILSVPVGDPVVYELCPESVQQYAIRVADRYGLPAETEALQRHPGDYRALHGARSTGSAFAPDALLRHYDLPDTPKQVSRSQPDWVYVYTGFPVDNRPLAVRVSLYINGEPAQNIAPYGSNTVTLQAGKIYCFPAGFEQMHLGINTDEEKTEYLWALYDPNTAEDIVTRRYLIRNEGTPGQDYILLYDNGVGGCDTECMFGHAGLGLEIEKEYAKREKNKQFTTADAQHIIASASARKKWTLNTDWHETAEYLERLGQIALAKHTWLVDVPNQRFLRVVVTSKSLVPKEPGNETGLYALSFEMLSAWEDTTINS